MIHFLFLIFSFCHAFAAVAIDRCDLDTIIKQATHPLHIVRHFIPDNPRIVEAGGHYGEDAVYMQGFWQNATIYTFEPNPSAYEKLRVHIEPYTSIFAYPFALYDYDGRVKFRIQLGGDNDGASSLLPPSPDYAEATHTHSWWYVEKEIEVPCITLDSWAKNHQIEDIDFMWLDMEGAELYALKAGLNVLKSVKAIYTEVNFQEFRIGMTQYDALSGFLKEQGFEEIYIDADHSFQANVIFVRKNLLSLGGSPI